MKINYRIEMERELDALRRAGRRPLLVLHSCCAPCSSAVLEQLDAAFRIVVFYYNPNISPEAEFHHRAEEQLRLVREMKLSEDMRVKIGEYDPRSFYDAVRGHESDPEGGARCGICFELRLRKTAEFARRIGAEYFTTTLSISPLKDAQRLNAIGSGIAEEMGVKYLFSDFKKKDGYRRSCALSQEYGLYRQDFCGCVYSKMEAERRRYGAEAIRAKLANAAPWKIEFHDSIDSTNLRAKELARQGAPHGTVVIADSQSAGRGRFQRAFLSPAHSGIYLSAVLRLGQDINIAGLLTPMAAVAVARAIEACADVRAEIKWVNDVYIAGKKVCGILCESGMDEQGDRYIVMGIGINVACVEFPDALRDIATSVSNACGRDVDRAQLAASLLDRLNELLGQIGDCTFMEEYIARSNVVGRELTVLRGDEAFAARALRIEKSGALVVRTADGNEIALSSGEVSLKFL